METVGPEPTSTDLQSVALTIFAIFPFVGKAGLEPTTSCFQNTYPTIGILPVFTCWDNRTWICNLVHGKSPGDFWASQCASNLLLPLSYISIAEGIGIEPCPYGPPKISSLVVHHCTLPSKNFLRRNEFPTPITTSRDTKLSKQVRAPPGYFSLCFVPLTTRRD